MALAPPAMEDPASGRRGDLLMAKIGRIAGWPGPSEPLLDEKITEVASIEDAGLNSVVFAVDKEAMTRALESKAGAILANTSLEDAGFPLDPRVLWVPDARYAFAVVGRPLRGKGFEAGIPPSPLLVEGGRIGEGTRSGPGVRLEDVGVVGSDCN